MKELEVSKVYLKDYDIHVNRFLTLAEIQMIINGTTKFKTYAERETNKMMMVLLYATDIGEEKLNDMGLELLIRSGLVEAVRTAIENYYEIDLGIGYTESVPRALMQISEKLPEWIEPIKEIIDKHNKKK